jgi:hypothetical protein
MFSSRDIEIPKFTRILWKMCESHVFWEFNTSWREHSFELKFSGHSSHKYSYLWTKLQLEITSFDFLVHTVHFPTSVGKILLLFVSTSTRLFYIWSKIFLQIGILWILLFQIIYYLFVNFHIFMVKLSVYGKELHPTELGGTSLILSVSRKMSLIQRLLIKYIEKLNFRGKYIFWCFSREMEGRCLRHFCRVGQALS